MTNTIDTTCKPPEANAVGRAVRNISGRIPLLRGVEPLKKFRA
jgi:hypothetical protein